MIKETIIVEGKNDIRAVKAALSSHVIATNGSHFGEEKLKEIKRAYETNGIIIFTDPDYAGIAIRNRLKKEFPDAKEVFLHRKDVIKDVDIGIEHAKPDMIKDAFKNLLTVDKKEPNEKINMAQMMRLGLSGTKDAKDKRDYISRKLRIGSCNAKRFLERVNHYNIDIEEIERLAKEYE